MNGKNIILLENICRACMNGDKEDDKEIGQKTKAISIFNEPGTLECKNITIMELLIITTPQLSIENDDMLPKTLCESCLERLVNAYKFQKMCVRVEQKLRQMINEDTPMDSKTSNDPLMDLSIENETVSVDINNILKVEIGGPLIDQSETIFKSDSVIEDTENVTLQSDCNRPEDATAGADSECQLEIASCNTKSKKSTKIVKKLNEALHKNCKDNSAKVGDRTSKKMRAKKNAKIACTCSANKKFSCDECGNRFTTRRSLTRHKRIHLRPVIESRRNIPEKPKYECEFCKKEFEQSSSLKDHLKIHTGRQPYLCTECGKTFKGMSNMRQHLLRHGTDRPYACPDCPKRFRCSSGLSAHRSVHNKIKKKNICDICGAAFVKPYQLKTHKMYHTGEKNYKCDYCDMRFVSADPCRRHMRTHTGEKPYKCKYCVRAFGQSYDLIKHLRGHLGDNVYKCDLCPQGFRLQGDLRIHFNTHKNDDEETRARNLQALKDEEHNLQTSFDPSK